ncbi:hypothetical protein ACFQE8_07490 [Salinirubellus sp. GCM10025818]|uniref:hypothetical protein n=1 Tax=Salinirubellus TaxID=2162630 RepID=UPI0030CA7FD1
MTHHPMEWDPQGALHTYRGYRVTDHTIGNHEFNPGEVDGEVDLGVGTAEEPDDEE